MSKTKNESKNTNLPSDAENLCAILARIVERIAQSPAPKSSEG